MDVIGHSKAYRRMLEGYEIISIPTGTGKFVTELNYTGDYYSYSKPIKNKVISGAFKMASFAVSFALFFKASSQTVPYNTSWYAASLQTAILLSFLWMLVSLIIWCAAPLKMKIREYKSGSRGLIRSSLLVSILMIADFAAEAVSSAFSSFGFRENLLELILLAAGAGICFAVNREERSKEYIISSN